LSYSQSTHWVQCVQTLHTSIYLFVFLLLIFCQPNLQGPCQWTKISTGKAIHYRVTKLWYYNSIILPSLNSSIKRNFFSPVITDPKIVHISSTCLYFISLFINVQNNELPNSIPLIHISIFTPVSHWLFLVNYLCHTF
jgi:hypothetical protein